jgi:hypothetical protein
MACDIEPARTHGVAIFFDRAVSGSPRGNRSGR